MAVTVLTDAFNKISLVCEQMIPYLQTPAERICASLIVIDLVLSTLASLENDVFSMLWKKFLNYGFYLYLIRNWDTLAVKIKNGFVWIGNMATGSASSVQKLNPEYIIAKGMNELSGFFAGSTVATGATFLINPAWGITVVVLAITIIIGLGFMAIELMMIKIEYFIVAGFSVMLLPFGVYKGTNFIAHKAFNGVLNVGIKMSVITLIYNVSFKILDSITIDFEDISSIVNYLVILLFLIFLCRRATMIANTVINGNGGIGSQEASNMRSQAGSVVQNSSQMSSKTVSAVQSAVNGGSSGSGASGGGTGGISNGTVSATQKATGGQ